MTVDTDTKTTADSEVPTVTSSTSGHSGSSHRHRGGSFFIVMLAALIGAGAIYLLQVFGPNSSAQSTDQRLQQVETELQQLRATTAQLNQRNELAARVNSLAERLETVSAVDDASASSTDDTVAALREELATLSVRIAEQPSLAELTVSKEWVNQRLASLEQQMTGLSERVDVFAEQVAQDQGGHDERLRVALRAFVASQLTESLANGTSLAGTDALLMALPGIEPAAVEALMQGSDEGIPTQAELLSQLGQVEKNIARHIWTTTPSAASGDGFLAQSWQTMRSLANRTWVWVRLQFAGKHIAAEDDPSALADIAHARGALTQDRLADAAAHLAALPTELAEYTNALRKAIARRQNAKALAASLVEPQP